MSTSFVNGSAGFTEPGMQSMRSNSPRLEISRKAIMSICKLRSVVFPSRSTTLNTVFLSISASMRIFFPSMSSRRSFTTNLKSKPSMRSWILAFITEISIILHRFLPYCMILQFPSSSAIRIKYPRWILHPFAFAKEASVRSTSLTFSGLSLNKLRPWFFVSLMNEVALLRVFYSSSVVCAFPGAMSCTGADTHMGVRLLVCTV